MFRQRLPLILALLWLTYTAVYVPVHVRGQAVLRGSDGEQAAHCASMVWPNDDAVDAESVVADCCVRDQGGETSSESDDDTSGDCAVCFLASITAPPPPFSLPPPIVAMGQLPFPALYDAAPSERQPIPISSRGPPV